MKLKYLLTTLVGFLVTACANNPQAPKESPISIQLKGTSTEVQQFIEERMRIRGNGAFTVENANDRVLTLKADCFKLPKINSVQCAALMMGIGNSRWDGPFLMVNFRTNQIREMVNVTLQTDWCAVNAFGKSNCMPAGNVSENNETLRQFKEAYEAEIRK